MGRRRGKEGTKTSRIDKDTFKNTNSLSSRGTCPRSEGRLSADSNDNLDTLITYAHGGIVPPTEIIIYSYIMFFSVGYLEHKGDIINRL